MGYDMQSPPYTPSPPSPHYSTEPLPGEQTVESTRYGSLRPTGVYRRITDHLTVVLKNQLPGSTCPIYGRSGLIQGDVILSSITSGFTSVVSKLEGHFSLNASGVTVSTTFLSVTRVLWTASHAQSTPQSIPFEFTFPLTFDDDGRSCSLPPSFESSELHAACSYLLTVEISRPRKHLSFLKHTIAVEVPITYRPRSRPHLPVPSGLPFMSTVKSSPEEWHEVICTVRMTQGSGLAPAECLFFVPSVQCFAPLDTIPFHLQIRGSPASLGPFLEHGQDSQSASGKQHGGVVIRVYLLRQCSARMQGLSSMACRSFGEGKMEPSRSPHPRHHTFTRHPLRNDMDTLDWDGILRCEDVSIPSFSTTQLSVRDFIVLSITPQQPLKSPLLDMTHSHPVRIVTDPWQGDAMT